MLILLVDRNTTPIYHKSSQESSPWICQFDWFLFSHFWWFVKASTAMRETLAVLHVFFVEGSMILNKISIDFTFNTIYIQLMLFICLQPADVKAPQFLEVERFLPFGNSLVPQRTMLSHGPVNHVKRWKWILWRFLLILNSGVSYDLDKCLFDYDWYDWIPGYWSLFH